MNERIKELIAKAGNLSFEEAWDEDRPPFEYIVHTKESSMYSSPFIEKFAELIVRECVSKLDGIGVIDRDSRTTAMKVISEHFGVEL